MKKAAIQGLLGVLFLSRDFAHKRHLAANGAGSFAEHMALGDFYDGIIPLADKLAEAWQGKNLTLIGDIPSLDTNFKESSVKGLQSQLEVVRQYRDDVEEYYSPIENILDEIEAAYLSAIYKLTFLK